MKEKDLKIAISQFPVSENIERNKNYMIRQIIQASKKHADIIHFPETSLSGYEMVLTKENWKALEEAVEMIKEQALKSKIFVVFGTYEKIASKNKSYNCIIVISDKGKQLGKYIKQNLYKAENDRFTAKKNSLILEIKGIKCGFLICNDSWYPDLFKSYREKGVELLFLSFYNAKSRKGKNSIDEIARAQFITRATDHLMYISGSNSSARYSRMPSSFVRPDGKIYQLPRHKAGLLFYDFPGEPLGWVHEHKKD